MTVEQLKAGLNTIVQLGDMLAPFIPGEWDSRIVEYARVLSVCDGLLILISDDLTPQERMFATAEGDVIILESADGRREELSPAVVAILIKVLLPVLLKWIENRKGRGE